MPALSVAAWSRVRSQVAARWEAIDPLLPAPAAPPGCGAEFVVGPRRQPVAIATCTHWKGRPGSLDLAWGAARRFRLSSLTAGPDVSGSLDEVLSLWRDHLAGLPAASADDTVASVTWPSRDIDGVAALLRHGLVALTVVAVRTAAGQGSPAGPPDAGPADVRIRRAGPEDVAAVTGLGMELIRFDAHFGSLVERPGTDDALGRHTARLLSGPQPWAWLAERDGAPVGMVTAERPDAATWISPLVRPAPAAYLGQMFVVPGERGRGVARALVETLHRETDAAGVAVTLLHYELLNPFSGPFWARQGYRPLWTIFEAQPARTLR